MSLQVWLPLNGSLENKGLAALTSSGTPVYKTIGKLSNKSLDLNTRVNFKCSALANKTIFSIAFWAKVNDDANLSINWVDVIGFTDVSTGGTSGQLRWETCYSSGLETRGISGHDNATYAITQYSAISGSAPVTVKNVWEHRAFTVSSTQCAEYVNGELRATYGINGGHLSGAFWLGQAGVINGEIQDVRIYDHTLSETEIKELSQGLVLHLPLNNNGLGQENLYTNSQDFSGSWINGSFWTTSSETYKGFTVKQKSSVWGGLAQNIPCFNGDIFTISFYAKVASGGNILSTHRSSLGNVTTGLTILGGNFSSNTNWINTGENGTYWKRYWATVQITSSDITYLQWRIENSVADKTLYICGMKLEKGSIATPWSPNPADENYPASGSGIPENLFAATDMSESIAAYNSSTDWTKHFRMYNGSAAIHTIDTTEMTDTIALTTAYSNLGIAFARLNKEINLDPNEYYTISCEAKCTNTNLKLCIGLSYYNDQSTWVWRGGSNAKTFTTADTWQKFTLTFKPDANTYAICYCFTINPGASPTGTDTFSIRKCKLEKGSTATEWQPSPIDDSYKTLGYYNNIEHDTSGYNHNGVKYGNLTYSSDAPKYNVSTYIDNNAKYIKIDNFPTAGFGDSYTFAWWGKINNHNYMQWGFVNGIRVNGMYTGCLWNTGDGSNNPLYIPGTTTQVSAPSNNVWHHYVMTGNGTSCLVYLDGELFGQAKTYKSISGTTIIINGWDEITRNYTSNNFKISDFRIYATALSEKDVKSLYNNNAYIDSDGKIYGKIR